MEDLAPLLQQIRACQKCTDLPLGPAPIVQFSARSRILIAGQAPGRITHHKGIPFDDPSGDRLREWLGVSREVFYNPSVFAIVPMGFCFPGTGKGGDLPPRPECALSWRTTILEALASVELTLVIGRYAIDWHTPQLAKASVTKAVSTDLWPETLVLPHPSPRNNRWLRTNSWFEDSIIPKLQARVQAVLKTHN